MPPPPPSTINNTANGPGMPWGGGGPHPPHLPNMPFTGRPQEVGYELQQFFLVGEDSKFSRSIVWYVILYTTLGCVIY